MRGRTGSSNFPAWYSRSWFSVAGRFNCVSSRRWQTNTDIPMKCGSIGRMMSQASMLTVDAPKSSRFKEEWVQPCWRTLTGCERYWPILCKTWIYLSLARLGRTKDTHDQGLWENKYVYIQIARDGRGNVEIGQNDRIYGRASAHCSLPDKGTKIVDGSKLGGFQGYCGDCEVDPSDCKWRRKHQTRYTQNQGDNKYETIWILIWGVSVLTRSPRILLQMQTRSWLPEVLSTTRLRS